MEAETQPQGDGRGAEADAGVSELVEASRAIVHVYKELFGRGPVKAWSHWAGDDTLICTLHETLTRAELSLRDLGEHERLRNMRTFFQYASLREFVAPIEAITGRTVHSFISGIDVQTNVAVEMFTFYPRGSEGPSRRESA